MEEAFVRWQTDNKIQLVDPTRDALYHYNAPLHKAKVDSKYWSGNPSYFQKVRVSAVAMLKMAIHAESGGDIEVMGVMQGYIDKDTFVVTDAIPLPVEGTETRVNAHDDANEYMVQYLQASQVNGRREHVVGWYHSHPGYGCWLSGIDVQTQELQQFTDPFLAIVVDPHRTMATGKVEIGAFRTFPDTSAEALKAQSLASGSHTAVPVDKAQDFGIHAHKYYSLEVTHYKSTLDTEILTGLWQKYWVQTLSAGNRTATDVDLATKELTSKVHDATMSVKMMGTGAPVSTEMAKKVMEKMDIVSTKGKNLATMEKAGITAVGMKKNLFNGLGFAALNQRRKMTE